MEVLRVNMADLKYTDYYGQPTDSFEEAEKGSKRNAENLKKALAEGSPVGSDYFGQPTTDPRQIERAKERKARDSSREDKDKKMAKGGKVPSASKKGDGIAQRGKTKGRMC
jgi:hypothetical protein